MNTLELIKELEQLENHDCHLTDEDSCATCERIWVIKADLEADENLRAIDKQLNTQTV